ncbi:hypothetical protein [Nocardia heshunensis]
MAAASEAAASLIPMSIDTEARARVSYGTDYNPDQKIHDDWRLRLIEFGTVFYDRIDAIANVT